MIKRCGIDRVYIITFSPVLHSLLPVFHVFYTVFTCKKLNMFENIYLL